MNPRQTPAFSWLATTLGFVCCLLGGLNPLSAQPTRATVLDFATGSDFEDYLRVLQVAGIAPLYPWSIRGFSPKEVTGFATADTVGPWRLHERFRRSVIELGPATVTSIYNSAFPYGANDGPLWAGRGLTVALGAGVSGGYGPLSFTIAPVAFRAGNAAFPLLANGQTGNQAYNHGTYSDFVDLPQRFGSGAYSRVDPGQTGVRVDTRFLTAGVSTANQWIGPATEYPFLLGTNAPGFPHVFVGTGSPVNLWAAHIHTRFMWGKLYQSDYGPVEGGTHYGDGGSGTERLTTSVTVVLVPRGVPGLELGVGRYFHVPNRGLRQQSFWTKPFKVFFQKREYAQGDSIGGDNQLTSAFFRWAFPASGFEVYGERGYEDQFYDLREFIQDLDHEREYMLGFQKTFRRRSGKIDVLRGELVNYQLPTLARLRFEGRVYLHDPLSQGHTNRGQLLGASPGVGAAAASTLSWVRYSSDGRSSVTLRRILRDEISDYDGAVSGNYNPLFPSTQIVDPNKATDVIMAVGFEKMKFTKYGEFGAGLEAMQNYNRNFSDNAANLNLHVMARVRAW